VNSKVLLPPKRLWIYSLKLLKKKTVTLNNSKN